MAYVYFDYQDQELQSPTNVFASILRQLSARMKDLIPEICALHKKLNARATRPHLFELVYCIIFSSASFLSTYVILDGLDAIDQKLRWQFLDVIRQLSEGSIKVFATGRSNLNDLFQSIPNIIIIPIRAHIDDLKNYITRELSQRKLGEKLEGRLMDKLSMQANGV